MNYLSMLEESYIEMREWGDESRLEFLAAAVFDFTTYENQVSHFMANKAVQVCEALNDGSTFDYIDTEEGNLWYLVMVNMPFFKDKISWGGSIRGAWWELYTDSESEFTISGCELFSEGVQLLELKFNEKEWISFIKDMVLFASKADSASDFD